MTAHILPDAGPMTLEEFRTIWESSVDPLYAQPLIEQGDGGGIEAFDQAFAQFARVSQAVDVTTQAMYILPWSGQTNAPAQGPQNARVTLTIARTQRIDQPLVLVAGLVLFEEQTTDWGLNPGDGQQIILTGRRYALVQDLVFGPGVAGPLTAEADAEQPGWGYNNPQPGTITSIHQAGSDYENVGASVAPSGPNSYLVAAGVPDVFIPEHVGQYFLLTGGGNAGTVARAVGYGGPVGTDGGRLLMQREVTLWGTAAGTFLAGEKVRQAISLAEARVVGATAAYLVVSSVVGTLDATHVLTGLTSGATFTPSAIARDNVLTPETGTAEWRVMSWTDDWGVTATNLEAPEGGRLGFLDELGRERNVRRGPQEPDDQYRDRVSRVADVVTPNALIRAANGVLAPLGLTGCFREAGQATLPGFYFDGPDRWDEGCVRVSPAVFFAFQQGEAVQQLDPATGQIALGRALMGYPTAGSLVRALDAIQPLQGTFQTGLPIVGQRSHASFTPGGGTLVPDTDPTIRYRYWFDFLEMRAFFIEAVPRVNFGEFGFAYDVGALGFYDDAPYVGFWDGFPAQAAAFYRTVWLAQENIKAGGVGHDLVLDSGPCS